MELYTHEFKLWRDSVSAGDLIYLSGTVYTARDTAHKRIVAMIQDGASLPFDLNGAFIYFAGPTPAKGSMATGACGPTTSSRMDPYTPYLMDLGLSGTIGKGMRSDEVKKAIIRNKGIYLCAIGGAGALAAESIKSLQVIAFDELGCESLKRLEIERFPLYVGIDPKGNSIFETCRS